MPNTSAQSRGYETIVVRTASEMDEALSVRRRVFIEEQGVPAEEEIDAHDADPVTVTTAVHVLVRRDGLAVATGRLLLPHGAASSSFAGPNSPREDNAHIGRVAVLAEFRRHGAGRAVMSALHTLGVERELRDITLAAQMHAIGFYERLGYVARGDVFLDAGIEHRWMDIRL
ncbi:MAG TPA: GNAT family N-acetyltransferase [Dehalococcoidia bacterium]|nr:GNAT family N-acetyltransferase [Dehalococcoidia bacterium]